MTVTVTGRASVGRAGPPRRRRSEQRLAGGRVWYESIRPAGCGAVAVDDARPTDQAGSASLGPAGRCNSESESMTGPGRGAAGPGPGPPHGAVGLFRCAGAGRDWPRRRHGVTVSQGASGSG